MALAYRNRPLRTAWNRFGPGSRPFFRGPRRPTRQLIATITEFVFAQAENLGADDFAVLPSRPCQILTSCHLVAFGLFKTADGRVVAIPKTSTEFADCS